MGSIDVKGDRKNQSPEALVTVCWQAEENGKCCESSSVKNFQFALEITRITIPVPRKVKGNNS